MINKKILIENPILYADSCDFLSQVFEYNCGKCLTKTILYLSITNRLHLPCYGSFLPHHILVKYSNHGTVYYIETNDNGRIFNFPDDINAYYPQLGIDYPVKYLLRSFSFLKNNSNKEIISNLICSRGLYYENVKKDNNSALNDYFEAMGLNFTDPDVYFNLGHLYYSINDTLKSISAYKTSLFFNSFDTKTYENLGSIFCERGLYDSALVYFNKALSIDTVSSNAFYGRAITHFRKREYNIAIKDYYSAFQLGNKFSDALFQIAKCYNNLSQTDSALYYFYYNQRMNPNEIDSYIELSKIYVDNYRLDSSIAICNRAINRGMSDHTIYNNRGVAYYRLNLYDKSLEDFNRSIEIKPDYTIAYENRIKVWIWLDNNKGLCEDMLKLKELTSTKVYDKFLETCK